MEMAGWTFWNENRQNYNGLIHPEVISVAFSPTVRPSRVPAWGNRSSLGKQVGSHRHLKHARA